MIDVDRLGASRARRPSPRGALAVMLLAACTRASSAPSDAAQTDASTDRAAADASVAEWVLAVNPAAPAAAVSPALLGHYDLSGALYRYADNAALVARMRDIGMREWRVGVGRWEVSTRLLPTRSDGSSCAAFTMAVPAEARAPAGATDESLAAERDWFTDSGSAVTLADTRDDARYALTYVRSVIDAAAAFGATPFVDVDLMPRALARTRTFSRVGPIAGLPDACLGTFSNGVSNAPPADASVFAAAVRGLVQRVVEGSGSERGRDAPFWELWNEHELGYAWTGTNDEYFAMALGALVQLDAYRASATSERVRALRFGLGSFAHASTAAAMLRAIDATPLPGGRYAPVDFVSFHAYDNDPLRVLAEVRSVAEARDASARYRTAELVLAEWGPFLDDRAPPSSAIDTSLMVATVLARAPAMGVTRTHRSIMYDFLPGVDMAITPLRHDLSPKPLYHAYALLHALVGDGAARLPIEGAPDGAFGDGLGAALVLQPSSGGARALVVNRDSVSHRASLVAGGVAAVPRRVRVFDDPAATPHDVAVSGAVVTVPARSIALIER